MATTNQTWDEIIAHGKQVVERDLEKSSGVLYEYATDAKQIADLNGGSFLSDKAQAALDDYIEATGYLQTGRKRSYLMRLADVAVTFPDLDDRRRQGCSFSVLYELKGLDAEKAGTMLDELITEYGSADKVPKRAARKKRDYVVGDVQKYGDVEKKKKSAKPAPVSRDDDDEGYDDEGDVSPSPESKAQEFADWLDTPEGQEAIKHNSKLKKNVQKVSDSMDRQTSENAERTFKERHPSLARNEKLMDAYSGLVSMGNAAAKSAGVIKSEKFYEDDESMNVLRPPFTRGQALMVALEGFFNGTAGIEDVEQAVAQWEQEFNNSQS